MTTTVIRRSTAATVVLWALQILSAAMFLFAGTSKIGGAPLMVHEFAIIGLGQWVRYLTGTIEIVSAVLLLVPRFAIVGAAALMVTMVGAILTHLFVTGGSPIPAIFLLCSTTAIAWMRFEER